MATPSVSNDFTTESGKYQAGDTIKFDFNINQYPQKTSPEGQFFK